MAGRIPRQFIDELLARTDIVEVVDARVPLRKAGSNFTACCPFHQEKTPSFSVSPDKQFYYCFGCGASGNAIGFLMEYEHAGFVEAVEELASRAGLEIPREAGTYDEDAQHQIIFAMLERASTWYQRQLRDHPQAHRATAYLKGRGLTGEVARRFGLGYAPPGWSNLAPALGVGERDERQLVQAGLLITREDGGCYDRFRDRVMFPIRDSRGRIIGFGGRVLTPEASPKYLNSPETPVFHKGRELYGLYEARKAERKPSRMLVVEGYMDVLALAQHGITGVVATLGTATTPAHLERLFRASPEVVFCFDGDSAGRKAAWKALDAALAFMRDGRQVRFMFLPEGDDPDSLIRSEGAERFTARVADSTPLSKYFFDSLAGQVDMSSVEGRARLAELARPHINQVPGGVYRTLMLESLAQLTRVDRARLDGLLQPARDPPPGQTMRKAQRSRHHRTLVRLAISLLLQRPDLGASVAEFEWMRYSPVPGVPLLGRLLEIFREDPHLNGAMAIERWRDAPEHEQLRKLLTLEQLLPDQRVQQEFLDTITRLRGQEKAEHLDLLHAKLKTGELNDDELQEFTRLLAERGGDAPT